MIRGKTVVTILKRETNEVLGVGCVVSEAGAPVCVEVEKRGGDFIKMMVTDDVYVRVGRNHLNGHLLPTIVTKGM